MSFVAWKYMYDKISHHDVSPCFFSNVYIIKHHTHTKGMTTLSHVIDYRAQHEKISIIRWIQVMWLMGATQLIQGYIRSKSTNTVSNFKTKPNQTILTFKQTKPIQNDSIWFSLDFNSICKNYKWKDIISCTQYK